MTLVERLAVALRDLALVNLEENARVRKATCVECGKRLPLNAYLGDTHG